MSRNGFGKLILFTDTLKSPLMCKLYKNGLLPSAQKWFGNDTSTWKLLEDNDPKHTSGLCKIFRADNNIESVPWPASSPDCNPIENVWSLLKLKINKEPPTSFVSFIKKIKKEWKNLSIEFAENLADSMESRVELLIERKGDYINY